MIRLLIGYLGYLLSTSLPVFSQPVVIVNDACFGGTDVDQLNSIVTPDGIQMIMAGSSYSPDGNLTSNAGLSDGWVIMIDGNNNVQYSGSTGGTNLDEFNSIEVISGGATAIYGSGQAISGAINCVSGNGRDLILTQIDQAGNLIQQKCLGGTQDDFAANIIRDPYTTGPLQYIITGHSRSSNSGIFTGLTNMGFLDMFVAKVDSQFNVLDIRLIQSSGFDLARFIEPIGNGKFLLMGESDGNNGDMAGSSPFGSDDVMVFELDYNFTILNKYRYGSSGVEHAYTFHVDTSGFAVGGSTSSVGFVGCTSNSVNAFVVKCDLSGIIQWNTCLEGSGSEYIHCAIRNSAGNALLIGGETESGDLDFNSNQGGLDCFLAGINYSTGSLEWTYTYGGPNYDGCLAMVESGNGQLVTVNYTDSDSGDVTCIPNGNREAWVVKFANYSGTGETQEFLSQVTLAPVPAKDYVDVKGLRLFRGLIRINNLLGETVFDRHVENQESIRLDTSMLDDGIYMIEITDPENYFSGKLIKIN